MRKKTLKTRKTQTNKKKRTSKGLVPKKRVRHPELVRFVPFFPTTFLHREKRKQKTKSCFAELALPTLFWQPCSANLALPSLLCQPCLANSDFPFYNVVFCFFFYVFEGCGLEDKGGAVYVFLCF